MTEFNVDAVTPCLDNYKLIEAENVWKTRIGNLNYQTRLSDTKLFKSDLPGFISACHVAYDEHRPLSIKPDDLLLLVLQVFAEDINQQSEQYRNVIVNHDEKIKIIFEAIKKLLEPPKVKKRRIIGFCPPDEVK